MEFNKDEFLDSYPDKLADLSKGQLNYRKIITTTAKDRLDDIRHSKVTRQRQEYLKERETLRSRIWTAKSAPYGKEDKRHLENIRCHIECQENLAVEIGQMKEDVSNIQRVIQRLNKEIFVLNKQCRSDPQQTAHVVRARKKLETLSNEMEFYVHVECNYKSENDRLREELMNLLNDRTFFNETYSKMVGQLSSDKKYLTDLIEFALGTFESSIHKFEKIENLAIKTDIEKDKYEGEVERLTAQTETTVNNELHLDFKRKIRTLTDIEPKEYRRREGLRRKYRKKIDLYHKVMEKILYFTDSHKIQTVIRKFQDHESWYYSYFNFSNELSYHLTLMDNAVNQFFRDIPKLRVKNRATLREQLQEIEQLEDTLKNQQKRNKNLKSQYAMNTNDLNRLLQGIGAMFELTRTDSTPFLTLLGDLSHVNLFNVQLVLKMLERRVLRVTAGVYISERIDPRRKVGDYIVQQIHKIAEWPTALNDIVLTHQCPECAEGDAFNVEDAGDTRIQINTPEETRRKLYERITQPEMQYRLHNLSECKLPKSRMLAAKKNLDT